MAQMLLGRFWLQNKDLGLSLGAIDIIFRAGSDPTNPGVCGVGRGPPNGEEGEAPLPPGGGRGPWLGSRWGNTGTGQTSS